MKVQKGRISDAKYDGYSRYCGPTSLSAITGKGTLEVCKQLRAMTGRESIKGMYNSEMLRYLEKLKYKVELVYQAAGGSAKAWIEAGKVPTAPRGLPMTLRKWHSDNARARDVYLVEVSGHYVVIHNGQVACTSNAGRLRPFGECRSTRKQVKRVWRVS